MVKRTSHRRLPALLLGGLVAVAAAGCDQGILDTNDPDNVQPGDFEDPSSIGTVINGFTGDFSVAVQNYVLYTGLFTDEFILSGTFPTRKEVDDRDIVPDNATLTGAMYTNLHVVLQQADKAVVVFEGFAGQEGVDEDLRLNGLALAKLYGAYTRLMLAEAYCQSILGGPEGESAPVLPDARMQEALALFAEAEQAAVDAGRSDVETAARVGQARANLWLRNFSQAATIAATVPSDFLFFADYSNNDPSQYNQVYAFTYGDQQALRWTVGNGSEPARANEKFAYYDEWVSLGRILEQPPSFRSFDSSIEVYLQTLYGSGVFPPSGPGQTADIIVASGFEADLIEAEAAVRAGNAGGAAAIVDPILAGANVAADDGSSLTFAPANFTGDLANDLAEIARARAAALWLTGERFGTFRRFLDDGVDLFPDKPGDDTAFPVVQQELDNNPNISAACPTGKPFN